MFLIRNKLVATAIVIIVVIMMFLARPRDFTMGNVYLVKDTKESNDNENYESGDSNGLMNSYAMYQNNISNMLGLSEENKDKISETLEEINWGNIFKRATSQLKSYGNEYENNGN